MRHEEPQVKGHLELRSWLTIAFLGVSAGVLFTLSATVVMPDGIHTLIQSVAEALTVSIVVALVVEPRLLRRFGEELASQTFWASFFSRAPRAYREAIQELASATQFGIEVNMKITLDWADDARTIIRFRYEFISYRENHSNKPFPIEPKASMGDSPFSSYKATIDRYEIICEGATFHGDPIMDGYSRVERARDGRLVVKPVDESASSYFEVPPGLRYTTIFSGTSYKNDVERVPLGMSTAVLSLTIELQGDALPDLWISVIHPSSEMLDPKLSADGSSLVSRGPIRIDEVSLSGSVVILYWARKHR